VISETQVVTVVQRLELVTAMFGDKVELTILPLDSESGRAVAVDEVFHIAVD
jgi:hypothetical protein